MSKKKEPATDQAASPQKKTSFIDKNDYITNRLCDSETRIPGLLTADDILMNDWPEPNWVVPNLLPVGLTIIAGAPKVGKSWLALQIAQAIASGGIALGVRVEQGKVLFLALEDPPSRLQNRMVLQSRPRGLQVDFLTIGDFVDYVGDMRNGGANILSEWIVKRAYTSVFIDTLSRSISGDQMDVKEMTEWLTPMQEVAHEHNCGVIFVDHHRKGNSFETNPVGDILGSTAKGAMADTVWGLYKENGKSQAKLAITGREVEARTLELRFDVQTGCWQNEGDVGDLKMTEQREMIINHLAKSGRLSCKEIADQLSLDKSNLHGQLQTMVGGKCITRTEEGDRVFYDLPNGNKVNTD